MALWNSGGNEWQSHLEDSYGKYSFRTALSLSATKLQRANLDQLESLHSETFKSVHAVLSRGDIALPDVYKWIAQNSPEHPLFVYHDDVTASPRYIVWQNAERGFNRAAHYFTGLFNKRPVERPVIGILASSDTITFYTTVMGAVRAGFVPFMISPRNGADAVAHLLRKTEAVGLLTGSETGIQTLAEKSLSLLDSGEKPVAIQKYSMPLFDDLYSSRVDHEQASFPEIEYDLSSVAMILHSSGTTAFPKPISWTHRDLLEISRTSYYGEVDLADLILGCHGLPVYHAMGVMLIAIGAMSGSTISSYKPHSPAVAPTPDNILDVASKTDNDFLCIVPSIIEEWSREPEKVTLLKKFKGVCFGGGPLSKAVGDYLVNAGVSLCQMYGLTETGAMNMIFPNTVGKDWDFYQLNPQANIVIQPRDEGKFELIAYADERWSPPVTNTEYNGRKAYATGDLVVPHPTKKGYWKILGRTDEQIMLSTGEKTNPVPLEKILLQSPHIQGAIMFGRGRPYNGVLVEPTEEHSFNPEDHTKLAAFRNLIWPTVERLNDYAPQHSRLFKEMILVTSPDKPFMYTAKGSTRRGVILNAYEAEINACYEEVERSATMDTPELNSFDAQSIQTFVRTVVTSVLDKEVPDDVDIFQCGCDSLQATWIRNKVLLVIKTHDLQASRQLSPNFVYQAPTISGISNLIMEALSLHPKDGADPSVSHIRKLQDTVKRLTASFPARPATLSPRTSSGDVILLTGTTGGLGANLVAHLTKDPTVRKIYAFNRPSEIIVQRQVDAFAKHGILEDCLRCPKYHLLEGDMSKPFFGLDKSTFEEVRDSVTHIINNAWPVDFNLNIISFEKHLQGTRNLVDFALSSPFVDPPRLLFISSIGIFRQPTSRAIAPEELVNEASVPLGQGYAESKWVCEHILNEATKETGLPTVVVRVGQLSGNRVGYWNEREWFPSIVKSALSVGCLPDVSGEGPISWLPLYDAGKGVAQMRHSKHPILHLVNPRPIPWRMYLEPICEELQVPLVPWNVWVSKLEDDLRDTSLSEVEHLQRNPALHLLEMFKHADLGDDFEPPGLVRLGTAKSTQVAPSLLDVEVSKDVGKQWVDAWRASGFLPPATK